MIYAFCVVLGFLLALFLVNADSIKRDSQRKKDRKRYKKLLNGTPKRVVHLYNWYDLFKYRKNPIYVNGQVLGVSDYEWLHCNDEYIRFYDKHGQRVGYVARKILRSYIDTNGQRQYVETLGMGNVPSAYGRTISASAVIEVY